MANTKKAGGSGMAHKGVRFALDEWADIEAAAKREGLKPSQFVRRVAVRAARREVR